MPCSHSICRKLPCSCACHRVPCAKKPARAKSKAPNPPKHGSSLKLTLSVTWTASTFDNGKRR